MVPLSNLIDLRQTHSAKERAMIYGDDEREEEAQSEEEKKIGNGVGEGTEDG